MGGSQPQRHRLRPVYLVRNGETWTFGLFSAMRLVAERRGYVVHHDGTFIGRVSTLPAVRDLIRRVLDERDPGRQTRVLQWQEPAAAASELPAPRVVEEVEVNEDDLILVGDPAQVAVWARQPAERVQEESTMKPRELRPDVAAMFPVDQENSVNDGAMPAEPQREQPATASTEPATGVTAAEGPAEVALDADGLLIEISATEPQNGAGIVVAVAATAADLPAVTASPAQVHPRRKPVEERSRQRDRSATAVRRLDARLAVIADRIELANAALRDELAMRVHAMNEKQRRAVSATLGAVAR